MSPSIYRCLVQYLTALFSSAGAISNGDIPDVLSTLLWIAIEPSTSMDLKRELGVSIDVICECIAPDSSVIKDVVSFIDKSQLTFSSPCHVIGVCHLHTTSQTLVHADANQQSPFYVVFGWWFQTYHTYR